MTLPTLQNVTVSSVDSARAIFFAVHCGILKKVERRLDVDERESLGSGDVYVWEERDFQSETSEGIERWTDGIKWGSSRVRNEFLFYYERDHDVKGAQPTQESPLIKQTYSVFVQDPDDCRARPRKWHMVAYYSQSTVERLRKVEDIPELASLKVPESLFRAARVKRGQGRARENSSPSPTLVAPLRHSSPIGHRAPPRLQRHSPGRPRSSSNEPRGGPSRAAPYTRIYQGPPSPVSQHDHLSPLGSLASPTSDYRSDYGVYSPPAETTLPHLSELGIPETMTLRRPASFPRYQAPAHCATSRLLPPPNTRLSTTMPRAALDTRALAALQKQFMK